MPGPIPITDPGFQRALGKMFKRHLAERIEETYAKISQPLAAWLPPTQLPLSYGNLAPETATEMEVPCPRCGHRAAPEHIVRMTSKRGYKCKCWNCQMAWEHEG